MAWGLEEGRVSEEVAGRGEFGVRDDIVEL